MPERTSVFTPEEIDYFASQRLGRLATVGADGAPHVMPVGYRYNPETDTIDIGGHNMGRSKKWRDLGRNPAVAFVVDDLLPPWKPRLIEVRGTAELLDDGGGGLGRGFSSELIRITPARIVTWGINDTDRNPELRVGGRDAAPRTPVS